MHQQREQEEVQARADRCPLLQGRWARRSSQEHVAHLGRPAATQRRKAQNKLMQFKPRRS
eukprot:13783705-Alexandrium_andersonii.AAC.1